MTRTDAILAFFALAFGFTVGVVTYEMAGGVPILKNGLYGLYGFPACLVLSAILGYKSPRLWWLWGILIVPPGLVWTHVKSVRPSPFILVEFFFLSVLALIAIAVAFFTASLGRAKQTPHQ